MRFENDGISLWFETPDAPGPGGTVRAGSEITITVAVHPGDRSNEVEVQYRINRGPTETVMANWLRNDARANVQYFRAQIPPLRAGDTVEYKAVCRCAGQQVPSPEQAKQFAASFRVMALNEMPNTALVDRPADYRPSYQLVDSTVNTSTGATSLKGATASAPHSRPAFALKDKKIQRRSDAARPVVPFPENYCSLAGPRLKETAGEQFQPYTLTSRVDAGIVTADPLGDPSAKLAEADAAFLQRRYLVARSAYIDAISMTIDQNQPDLIVTATIGEAACDHELGNFALAEDIYNAVSYGEHYPPVSQDQSAFLFLRFGTLYLDWGDALFRNDQFEDALAQYTQVITVQGQPPTSVLYTYFNLKVPAADAVKVINNLAALVAGQTTAQALNVNPLLAGLIIGVHQQIIKITNGLDYWGHHTNTVPIWTFDYLQSAAINFTQLAISVERDFINFQDKSDQGSLTRQQLQQMLNQANAEIDAASAQVDAANAEELAYKDGAALANQRWKDADKNWQEYKDTSSLAIQFSATASQISGGDNGDPDELNYLANELLAGGGLVFENDPEKARRNLTASRAAVVAANQLAEARLTQQYEIDSLQRTAAEMQVAAAQAQQEVEAAAAKVKAAQAAEAVTRVHVEGALQNLLAFDSQTFTPDVWQRMADTMWRLYRRYLGMALQTALLMQRAYNYETDQSLKFIKSDYSSDEVKGLLGADILMADIQSLTYDLITNTTGKPQPMRQTISLAQNYPFLFERQFRKTGVMEFETRIDDFDYLYPGTCAGRIENVEVDVVGLVPVAGLSGTLTNSGISGYRTPAAASAPGTSGLKYRVQSKETLVLSDYTTRNDTLLVQTDQKMNRIFQGAGLVSTWRLEIPKAVNDIDYGALLDVRITFYYKARYDPDLHDQVLAELASRPGINVRQRGIPLRWLYPDAFFRFQDTGNLAISLKTSDFRFNETKPVLTKIGAVVATDGSVAASGITVALSTPSEMPGQGAIAATTNADGVIDADSPSGSAWMSLVGSTAIGDYALTVSAAANPSLVKNGTLDLSSIVNIALVLGYSFTPKS